MSAAQPLPVTTPAAAGWRFRAVGFPPPPPPLPLLMWRWAALLCSVCGLGVTSGSALGDAALYEAYSSLHALSQQTDALEVQALQAPTVVVCGRQTDGKSALLEALMGFQFNHVGGGTKTRRPIALQMQYHPDRDEPACYLHTAADGEVALGLHDLQAHIERENERLVREHTALYKPAHASSLGGGWAITLRPVCRLPLSPSFASRPRPCLSAGAPRRLFRRGDRRAHRVQVCGG